jgi:hypothetical protein
MAGAAANAHLLVQSIEEFLASHPAAAVLEEGRVVFEMRNARYSICEQHGRCQLQIWNEEHNLIRTVVEVQARAHSLRLFTRRLGVLKPQSLELITCSDRRTPSLREGARRTYQRLLERVLTRNYPTARVEGMRSAMDLEHSFGPAYTRGRLLQGPDAEAVIGIGAAESAATIDGILTIGLLWLDYCRQHAEARRHFGTLKVVVPAGAGRTTAERMAWLNPARAHYQLFTLDERSEELIAIDYRDAGNLEYRLVHAHAIDATLQRCSQGIAEMMALLPAADRARVEVRANSATEAGLLLHGLEFARVRITTAANSFQRAEEISFGAGSNETPLTGESRNLCRTLLQRLFASRHPQGSHNDALFRLQPERWLESRLRAAIVDLLPQLGQHPIYTQVPAMAAGDRGMLDLLGLDRNGRLTILEIKADEDLHLPLQSLDYWIRVKALLEDRQPLPGAEESLNAFQRHGYFPGARMADLPPRLVLVAPALRIHPANDPVLRTLSTQVEWELVALNEDWRKELKVIFRKHCGES